MNTNRMARIHSHSCQENTRTKKNDSEGRPAIFVLSEKEFLSDAADGAGSEPKKLPTPVAVSDR